ncbi:MAG TPA: hypothetical protein VGD08_07685 [Stellaceae bacterium]|jgi:hypothetical protein
MTTARDRSGESVVDTSLPKAEQEKHVEDEIEKDDAELYGPAGNGGGDSAADRTQPTERPS